jgi:DNA-binding PadR family transcriptional regulator
MMKLLTKQEELLMLTVFRLNQRGTLADIRNHLLINTGRDWAFASLYLTLEKLVRKGFLSVELGEPMPIRGGRAIKSYSLTKDGISTLRKEKELKERMWAGFPDTAKTKKNG